MVKGICVSFISLLLLTSIRSGAQDTITVPLHLRAGGDIAAPVLKLVNNDLISYGALFSVDLDESYTAVAGMRYSSFSTSQYSYDYKSRGLSFVIGADYNFLKPKVAAGQYYAGIGIRYGLTFYGQEASRIEYSNPWGTGVTSLALSHHTGHFLEFTPGVRTELFRGVTLGWNLNIKVLLSSGAGTHLRPVFMPGFGYASTGVATGAEYYVSFSMAYKKIRVFIKPKPVPSEEDVEGSTETTTGTTVSGSRGGL